MKKQNNKKGHKTLVFVVLSVAFVFAVVSFKSKSSDTTKGFIQTPLNPVQLILQKATSSPVVSRFSPILIFKDEGGGQFLFVGSGSSFHGSQGEQIITAEHLLPEGSGDALYLERPLRSNGVSGIEKVLYTGRQIAGGTADIVILKIGNPKLIKGFSVHIPGAIEKGKSDITRLDGTLMVLTSLVTGEKVKVLGTRTDVSDPRTMYALIDYPSIAGESGTGFVNEEDEIFVLKGASENLSPEVYKLFEDFKELAVVYGPLKIR